jgi:type II secretory pathway component PulK
MHRLAMEPDPATRGTNVAWKVVQDWTDPQGVGIRVRIEDESRRFDLNNLAVTTTGDMRTPEQVLLDLFVQCGEFSSGDRVRALKDWVDADLEGPREAGFYLAQDRDRLPSNRELTSWEALMHVDGWNEDLFQRRPVRTQRRDLFDASPADVFTLLPRARDRIIPVNLNEAPRAVLLGLLGMEQETSVDRILTFREMRHLHSLSMLEGLVPEETLRSVGPYFDVRSSWFSIHIAAYRDGISARSRWLVHRDPQGEVAVVQSVF